MGNLRETESVGENQASVTFILRSLLAGKTRFLNTSPKLIGEWYTFSTPIVPFFNHSSHFRCLRRRREVRNTNENFLSWFAVNYLVPDL